MVVGVTSQNRNRLVEDGVILLSLLGKECAVCFFLLCTVFIACFNYSCLSQSAAKLLLLKFKQCVYVINKS